jgi:malonyl-CoA/methylmalonyl-CoA synthetase
LTLLLCESAGIEDSLAPSAVPRVGRPSGYGPSGPRVKPEDDEQERGRSLAQSAATLAPNSITPTTKAAGGPPMSQNLFNLVRAAAEGAPERLFLRTGDGRDMSYGDVLERTGRMANVLTSLGVRPGDRVAAQVEKSPEVVLLYLATLRAGAVYLPLNAAYTLSELEYFLGDAEPRVVVCGPERIEAVAALGARLGAAASLTLSDDGLSGTLIEAAAAAAAAFAEVPRETDDLAAILYTSGTTGRSKGAMLTHANLTSNALVLKDDWRFTERDVLLHALPIYHTHGLFVAVNTVLAARASLLFLPKFDAGEIIRLMPQASVLMGVPTFYTRLLADPRLDRELVANMRLFISGSAPLLAETHREFSARTGQAILERYGMTETNMNTSNPYDGERIAGTVGFPLPGVALRIADAQTGRVLPDGEIGVIEVKGPNVFKGYWRMPEKTAAEFRADGYFITGDLGVVDARGYVSIVGREKDLIITGGLNVYPKEVEGEIDALPGVEESAVFGVPDPDFGEAVAAVVVLRAGAALTEAQVIGALEARLAKFKRPKKVAFVDALPRNAMGKVQKAALRARFG